MSVMKLYIQNVQCTVTFN